MNNTILLIGGPSSGKTHFGAQLLSRLQRRTGALSLCKDEAPTNLALFENVLQRLGQGLSSDHTESGSYREVVLPAVANSGQRLDLVWPDYAGEQVIGEKGIAQVRAVTPNWMKCAARSDHWILMVRPMLAISQDDLLNRPLNNDSPRVPSTEHHQVDSAQSQLVELLQVLRHVKGINNLCMTQSPRMLVLLSCWDELPQKPTTPEQVLAQRLPMLCAFLKANWAANSLSVYGLSALGKSLSHAEVDVEYQDRGPEAFGFVVLPSGAESPDLTLPVAHLAE